MIVYEADLNKVYSYEKESWKNKHIVLTYCYLILKSYTSSKDLIKFNSCMPQNLQQSEFVSQKAFNHSSTKSTSTLVILKALHGIKNLSSHHKNT